MMVKYISNLINHFSTNEFILRFKKYTYIDLVNSEMVNFRTKYCNSGVPNSSSKHSKNVNNNFLILKKDQLKVLKVI